MVPEEACRRACHAERVVADGGGSTEGSGPDPAGETVGPALWLLTDETGTGEFPVLTERETRELGGGHGAKLMRDTCTEQKR